MKKKFFFLPFQETPLNGDATVLSENAAAQAIRKSYVYGVSDIPLIFDTIGERLRMAADQVYFPANPLSFLFSFFVSIKILPYI